MGASRIGARVVIPSRGIPMELLDIAPELAYLALALVMAVFS